MIGWAFCTSSALWRRALGRRYIATWLANRHITEQKGGAGEAWFALRACNSWYQSGTERYFFRLVQMAAIQQ